MEILFIIQCIYFMLPAYIANMMPVFVRRINFLNYPIDFGKEFRGKRILGKSKTFRGYFFGVLIAMLTAYLQARFSSSSLSLIDYGLINPLLLGFLLGFGALLGDSIKSFFKRQKGIEPGKSFIPWDQLDFVLGSLLLVSSYLFIGWRAVIVIIIASVLGHFLINIIGYYLGIRKEKW